MRNKKGKRGRMEEGERGEGGEILGCIFNAYSMGFCETEWIENFV